MPLRRVPVDLIYVPFQDELADERAQVLVPVVCHRPLMALSRHIRYGDDSLNDYWPWAEAQGQIRDRKVHLDDWKRKYHQSYWSRCWSASTKPTVTYIDRDRLRLESGLEQTCLAKAADTRWMWVDMSAASASSWDQRSVEKLRHVVRETRRKEFYNPVLHDQYRRARIVRPDSIRIDRIRRLFGADGSGSRGLDIGCNMGYTSHMLQRHGVNMTGIDFDESHLSVARALDQTYGLGTPFVSGRFEQFDASEKFDIVVLLTVMYHALNVGQKEAIDMIKHIDRLDASVLVWESGSYAKREIELIRENSGLTTYLPLGSTQATGKDRELGVFVRPGTPLGESLAARYRRHLAAEFESISVMGSGLQSVHS
ncbi:MAG: class I SAM-dependent methyltransferase [Planctomycetota bacterium]|nr:class I SAM-dependent methyltransferase [Planctomycetota bacterium]